MEDSCGRKTHERLNRVFKNTPFSQALRNSMQPFGVSLTEENLVSFFFFKVSK